MKHKRSDEFHVGQEVRCANPESFLSPIDKYLVNRVGVVTKIYPSELTPEQRRIYCGPVNKVEVVWQKRNGRGKEKDMRMEPRDLVPADLTVTPSSTAS